MATFVPCGLALCVVLASATFAGHYTAVSSTAMAITGDIELDETGITFENGEQITFEDRVGDALEVDGQTVEAQVFSVREPSDPELLNGNRLCGAPVTFVASWGGNDDTTIMAVFATEQAPGSDAEMCASYTYE